MLFVTLDLAVRSGFDLMRGLLGICPSRAAASVSETENAIEFWPNVRPHKTT